VKPAAFVAVLDACVLYPAPLRDLLMWLALSGQFRAQWSEDIHREWKTNLLNNRPDLLQAQVDRTAQLMDQAIPGALVKGYEPLISGLDLPDENDRHVLAAAIRSGANVIVTFNLKDFPRATVQAFGIKAKHPDDFVHDLIQLDASAVTLAARRQRLHLKNPAISINEYLEVIGNLGMPKTLIALSSMRLLL
jgi:predicted nucleic acid-binding protein